MDELKTKRLHKTKTGALPKTVAAHAAAALAGFCLAAVRFEGELAPFGAAFAAGAAWPYPITAAVGAATGALVFLPSLNALKYISAALFAVLLRISYDRFFRPGRELLLYPLFSFAAVTVAAGVIALAAGTGPAWPVTVLCEGLISGVSALFFYRAFQVLPAGGAALGAAAGDTVAVLFSGGVLLLSLDGFRPWGVSPAHIFAYLAVLLLSFCAGQGAGTAAGVAAGLMLGFAPENVFLAYFLPAAGLLCGVLAGYGRLAAAGAFAVLGAMFLVLRGAGESAAVSIAEIVFSALAFALLPRRFLSLCTQRLRPLSRERYAGQARETVRLRLRGAAGALRYAAESALNVRRRLSPAPGPAALTPAVRRQVCEDCPKKELCWGALAETTRRAFAGAEKLLRENGALAPEELPSALGNTCAHTQALVSAFEGALWEQNVKLAAQNEIFNIKTASAQQLGGMAAVLENAAEAAAAPAEAEPYLAALAQDAFFEAGYRCSSPCVSFNAHGKLLLQAVCTRIPRGADHAALLETLRRKTNAAFCGPVREEYKNEGVLLSFWERPPLRVSCCRRVSPAAGERLCGDTVRCFADGRGAYYCVLSDGMGTGKTAALDSAMTCALFSRLTRAGFAPEAALGAVNCALSLKSEEETLATLDVLRLDLYTGEAALHKAGGARTVVRQGNKTAVIEPASLPLGILREVKLASEVLQLGAGDALLLLSDGAANVPAAFLRELLLKNKTAGAQELADAVLEEAVRRAPIGHQDDITAVAVVLEENPAI